MTATSSGVSAARQAYEHLKEQILANRLEPGTELREATVSTGSGFGRTPVREALGRLVQDGLVEVRPRQGYRVAPVTLHRVRELFEMRLLLEPAAAELAARRASDAQLAALAELAHREYPADDPARYEQFLADNRELHVAMAEAAGNAILARTLRGLLEEMHRLFALSLGTAATEQLHEHHELFDALLDRDPAAARAIVEEQVAASRALVLRALVEGAGGHGGEVEI